MTNETIKHRYDRIIKGQVEMRKATAVALGATVMGSLATVGAAIDHEPVYATIAGVFSSIYAYMAIDGGLRASQLNQQAAVLEPYVTGPMPTHSSELIAE